MIEDFSSHQKKAEEAKKQSEEQEVQKLMDLYSELPPEKQEIAIEYFKQILKDIPPEACDIVKFHGNNDRE